MWTEGEQERGMGQKDAGTKDNKNLTLGLIYY